MIPLLLATLVLPGGSGAKLKVPGDFPTIQAAVDASSPGDVILVKKGVYPESVVLNGKFGIQLVGLGKPLVQSPDAPGFTLLFSENVEIRGFDVGSTSSDGVLLDTCTNVRVSKCRISGALGEGIRAELGSGNRIDGNRITGAGINGIAVSGSDALIEKNVIVQPDEDGIRVGGGGHLITKNVVTSPGDDGISTGLVAGASGIEIRKNKVVDADDDAINVEGAANVAVGNSVFFPGDDGVFLRGPDHVVEKNKIVGPGSDGVDVDFSATGSTLRSNSVVGADEDGFDVEGDGTLVELNRSVGATETGFLVESAGNTVQGNKASKSGGFDLADLMGPGVNTYVGNKFKKTNIPL